MSSADWVKPGAKITCKKEIIIPLIEGGEFKIPTGYKAILVDINKSELEIYPVLYRLNEDFESFYYACMGPTDLTAFLRDWQPR